MLFHPFYMITNAAYCGHMGGQELAGFGLGSLTLGILAISVGTSFTLTLSTFVGPAFGAKDFRMCRVYLNRQYYLNTIVFICICIPLLFVKQIYAAIGQNPEIADFASQYVWIVLPGLYFHF
jgi:Na+-driven multidrug efflux pump